MSSPVTSSQPLYSCFFLYCSLYEEMLLGSIILFVSVHRVATGEKIAALPNWQVVVQAWDCRTVSPVVGRWPLPLGHSRSSSLTTPQTLQAQQIFLRGLLFTRALTRCTHVGHSYLWALLLWQRSRSINLFSCWMQLKYHCSLTRFATLEDDGDDDDVDDDDGNNEADDGGGGDGGSAWYLAVIWNESEK